ncbi:MAG TPA: glycosyltransferase family 39 protein [Candidatus Eisenbacteria bacterium]
MSEGLAPPPPLAWRPLLALAIVLLVAECAVLRQYGWFRDEFYYLACADHPAMGYVDEPPLSIWLLTAWRALFGESLAALRLLPALVGAVSVFLTGVLARSFGGGRGAQVLAALAALTAPTLLGTFHYVSMNSFDLLLWLLAFLAFARAIRTRMTRDWLVLGLVIGLGLLDKISVLWLLAGIGAGLLLSGHRRELARPGPWLAGGIALLVFSPYLVWEVAHRWPTLEFMRNATGRKMVTTGAVTFWAQQALSMNPGTLLVWLPGLAWLLFARAGRTWRPFGIAFVVAAIILMAGGRSRPSYLAPAYFALFAAGGVALESWLAGGRRAWARGAVAALMIAIGVLISPFALPFLPVERFIGYARAAGVGPRAEERLALGPLPQGYADMFGWTELTDEVARAWTSLTPEEREHAAIFGQNYGEAGAVAVLGRSRGLRPVLSGHNNYWLWGPPDREIRVLVIIGSNAHDNGEFFEHVVQVGTADNPYAMPYERHLPVWIGRGPRVDLRQAWGRLKLYI